MKYFSQRAKLQDRSSLAPIPLMFWKAWLGYVSELGVQDYLCEKFGDTCPDGHSVGVSNESIKNRFIRELGHDEWPIGEMVLSKNVSRGLDLIEFFFRFVSKPVESWFHQYCGCSHPSKYDTKAGRLAYTIEVNRLFQNFSIPLRLEKGLVRATTSQILERGVLDFELETNDNHLRDLINSAIKAFRDGTPSRKRDALRFTVDAFERLKTYRCKENKKKGINELLHEISENVEIRDIFNEDMNSLTAIANGFCIRHHEHSQKEISDDDFVEFLFFLYFNFIRFIMKKFKMIEESKTIGGSPKDEHAQ